MGTNHQFTLQCVSPFTLKAIQAKAYNKGSLCIEETGWRTWLSEKPSPRTNPIQTSEQLPLLELECHVPAGWKIQVCFGTDTFKSALPQQKLTAALTRKIQPECLRKPTATKKVNTLKPLPKNTTRYGYLPKVCLAGSFNSSNRDSPNSYRWVPRNQGIIICVFWKQHQYRESISQFVRVILTCRDVALQGIPLQIEKQHFTHSVMLSSSHGTFPEIFRSDSQTQAAKSFPFFWNRFNANSKMVSKVTKAVSAKAWGSFLI